MKNYFLFENSWKKHSVEISIVHPQYRGMDAYDIANFIDFWYIKGSKFYTHITCEIFIILSQEFKDLYDAEGWTGLSFGEPIKIHELKKELTQPMNYYKVDFVGRCDKIKAHRLYSEGDTFYKTDWEVINDNGFDFFRPHGLPFSICSEKVMKKIVARKMTNILFEELKSSESRVIHIEPIDQMEF